MFDFLRRVKVEDPVSTTMGMLVKHELTESELRGRAAVQLGADVVSGMAVGELILWYQHENNS